MPFSRDTNPQLLCNLRTHLMLAWCRTSSFWWWHSATPQAAAPQYAVVVQLFGLYVVIRHTAVLRVSSWTQEKWSAVLYFTLLYSVLCTLYCFLFGHLLFHLSFAGHCVLACQLSFSTLLVDAAAAATAVEGLSTPSCLGHYFASVLV